MADDGLERMYRTCADRLMAYLLARTGDPHAAADLVQETFLVAHRRLQEFDPARDAGPWLRGIARNLSRNVWRKRAARMETPIDESALETVFAAFDRHAAAAGPESRLDLLDLCIERLPDRQRDAVRRHYTDDWSARQIAAEWGVNEKTVFQSLWHARRNLRLCVEQETATGT